MTELQEKVLQLLKDIDKLCRENEVDYYLTAGTLLGAMRHKGFIPWDDDADIIMTRDNWEKFLEKTRGKLPEGIALNTPYDDANLAMTANHYVDTTTAAIYRYDLTNPEKTGIMLDVIIMDPVPEGEREKKVYIDALSTHTELTALPYQYSIRTGESTHFGKYWFLSRVFGMKKVLERIDKEAFSYKEDQSRYYVQRFAGSPHFWPKEYFGKPKYVPFEDTQLPVPERAGDCLCIGYDDDWMYVPAGGVTKSIHDFCVRNLNVPGEVITADFETRIDRKKLLKTYVKKKKIQVRETENKFRVALESDQFVTAWVKMVYAEKRKTGGFQTFLNRKDYDSLEDYFKDYIQIQCSNRFLGSSSLTGWINWYRKCNPQLIDIGDEELYAVLILLMHQQRLAWTGKLLKARKNISRPMPESLEDMDALYQAVKDAASAYECEKWEQCRSIVNAFLPIYPENPFLYKLELKLRRREGILPNKLLKRAEEGLELFPDDSELLFLEAEANFEMGQYKRGLEIYQKLSVETNHGIVLMQMREKMESLIKGRPDERILYEIWLQIRQRMGEEELPNIEELCPNKEMTDEEAENILINDLAETSPETAPVHELTEIQRRRLMLLTELAKICKENHIKYYLIGKALWQAARNGKYEDINGELVVAMLPKDCKKFTEAVARQNRSDRYLDSMDVNPYFHRFCVRYGDKESLDFAIERSGCGNDFGIYITIEILRYAAKSRWTNSLNQMLESGWESSLIMKWMSPKRWISRMIITVLCAALGRERVAKWLYRRFMTVPKKKRGGRYFTKPFWGKRVFYPAYLFKYVKGISLEGKRFTTMKMSDVYLKGQYGTNWKRKPLTQTKINLFTRIIDTKISSQEFLRFLDEQKIDRKAIWKLRRRTEYRYSPVITLGSVTSKYWDIMCFCGERYRLFEKYIPMRTYLIELFKSNRVKELSKELQDYYKTALSYSKKGMGICFDKKIFELMEYCLRVSGKEKQARRLRKLIPKQDWKPIKVDGITGGYGMRKAEQKDIPAILVYLKRNVKNCLYMYIDIKKYGLDNPNITVWMDSDETGMKLVVMKYHTSISVFSASNNWDVDEVVNIINQEAVNSVTGKKDMIEKLYISCADKYDVTYGSVFRFTSFRSCEFDGKIETAAEEDTMEIAELIARDEEIGGYYEIKDLADQLAERMRTNMGRSYVIRKDGKIIAHIASYAEFENLATTGGLIVAPEYRNGVYGGVLEGYLVERLLEEKFQVYTFVTARLRKKLLEAVGNKCVGEYGKMAIKHEALN